MKIAKGKRIQDVSTSSEWWEMELKMDSLFGQMKDGVCIGTLTLDELLSELAPNGTRLCPLIEKEIKDIILPEGITK